MPTKLTDLPKTLIDLPLDITAASIDQYLTDKDKSALTVVSKTTQSLFQPARMQEMANKLLLQVMHGEQEKAAKILKIHPGLLMKTGTATDYSGRTFETTAFRYALWALDTRYMCNMMLDCLSESVQGPDITRGLLEQFNAQVQDGLDYKLNGTTIHEVHYDFSSIKAVLKNYVDECKPDDSAEIRNHLSKVVGLAQRYVPAHVAQHYCDPDEAFSPTPPFNKKTFKRSLEFNNFDLSTQKFWYAAVSSTDGLGVNFGVNFGIIRSYKGIYSSNRPARESEIRSVLHFPDNVLVSKDLAALTALFEVRTADLALLKQRLEGPIPAPDAAVTQGWCTIS